VVVAHDEIHGIDVSSCVVLPPPPLLFLRSTAVYNGFSAAFSNKRHRGDQHVTSLSVLACEI